MEGGEQQFAASTEELRILVVGCLLSYLIGIGNSIDLGIEEKG